jgi:hypothetical protein
VHVIGLFTLKSFKPVVNYCLEIIDIETKAQYYAFRRYKKIAIEKTYALTRTPCLASSIAKALVSAIVPPLENGT